MKRFLLERLKDLPLNISENSLGNFFITKGETEMYPCVTAHLDEVHDEAPFRIVEEGTRIWGENEDGTQAGIGADDKADILLDIADKGDADTSAKYSKTARKKQEKEEKLTDVPQDILHARLFNRLRTWRAEKARELSMPAYVVFSQRALVSMTNVQPRTVGELKKLPGVGKAVIERYGETLLELINEYLLEEED